MDNLYKFKEEKDVDTVEDIVENIDEDIEVPPATQGRRHVKNAEVVAEVTHEVFHTTVKETKIFKEGGEL